MALTLCFNFQFFTLIAVEAWLTPYKYTLPTRVTIPSVVVLGQTIEHCAGD